MRRTAAAIFLLLYFSLYVLITNVSGATLFVDADRLLDPVNPLIFGNAQPFGHGDVLLEPGTTILNTEALDLVSDLAPTLLRFPGGIHADEYFWEDGIGPLYNRPQPRPGQYQPHGFAYGTDEHMALCQAIGAEAFITVNYGSGIVDGCLSEEAPLSQRLQRAADWVEYCNAPYDGSNPNGGVDWASRRAQYGHPQPYGVRFWEIGNEIYGSEQTGRTDVETYAGNFNLFVQTMKAVDPTIRIGAVGSIGPHWRTWWNRSTLEWNATLLEIAGQAMDFLVVHCHYPGITDIQGTDLYRAGMAGAEQALIDLQEIREIIDQLAGPSVGIVPGENGFTGGVEHHWELCASLLAGLHQADLLMMFLEQGTSLNIDFACGWTLHSSTYGGDIAYRWTPERRFATPEYYAQLMFREHFGDILVADSVECGTFPTVEVVKVAERDDVPELSLSASLDSTGTRLYLMVVNRQLEEDVEATMQISGFESQPEANVWTMNGPSVVTTNEEVHDAVRIVHNTSVPVKANFSYTFPAHSLTAIEMTRWIPEPEPSPPLISGVHVTDIAATRASIIWQTNRPVDSRVEYGIFADSTLYLAVETDLRTAHHVVLEGLIPETQYSFRVSGCDSSGIETSPWEGTFWTTDVTSPLISQVEITEDMDNGVLVTWRTDKPADSRVEYQAFSDSVSHLVTDMAFRTEHQIVLAELTSETCYAIRVLGRDASGNEAVPWESIFWTADVDAPLIDQLEVLAITESTATISWETNEPGDSRVEYQRTGGPAYSVFDSMTCREHLIILTGLQPATGYIFQVCSADSVGNICQSVSDGFTTGSPRSAAGEAEFSDLVPGQFQLWQNYPNPFNGSTNIRYQVPRNGVVAIRVYNAMGQLVQTLSEGFQDTGIYEVSWDGRDDPGSEVASGIYLCYLEAGEYRQIRKMALVR